MIKKKNQKNMKEYDKQKSHINSNIHVTVYRLCHVMAY